MTTDDLKDLALEALDELKAQDVVTLDVRDKATFADYMIIATGTSNRHVKSLADNVHRMAKQQGAEVIGTEGEEQAEWVLVDLGDTIVHVMLRTVRDFYNLEKLWADTPSASQTALS